MDKTVSVEAKPGDVLVMHEVLSLGFELVVFIPIPPNSQNLAGALLHSDDVRQRDARHLTVFVLVLKPNEVQVNVHLKHAEPIVIDGRHARLFSLLLLNVVQLVARLAQLHVHVEPSGYQLEQVILGFTHHMRYPLGRLKTRRAIRHHNVLRADKHRYLTPLARVKVHLFERRACQRQ